MDAVKLSAGTLYQYEVNGKTYHAGEQSDAIALGYGDQTIEITASGEGVLPKTYTLEIYRPYVTLDYRAEILYFNAEECTITDENGNVLDVYTVDPKTGTGTDSSNAEVNLPQTGNNSMTNWLLCVGAAMFMALGFGAVKASGILKRKEDE